MEGIAWTNGGSGRPGWRWAPQGAPGPESELIRPGLLLRYEPVGSCALSLCVHGSTPLSPGPSDSDTPLVQSNRTRLLRERPACVLARARNSASPAESRLKYAEKKKKKKRYFGAVGRRYPLGVEWDTTQDPHILCTGQRKESVSVCC